MALLSVLSFEMAHQGNATQPVEAAQVAPPPSLTKAQVDALLARRRELSSQLSSAIDRRGELMREMNRAPQDARAGYVEQIKLLDERILQLERDLAETGQQIASPAATMARVLQSEPPTPPVMGMSEDTFVIVSSLLTIFVLSPIAIAIARILWRRATTVAPKGLPHLEARLERIEQALDAISIEVERIAEAQRFQTRLLANAAEEKGLLVRAVAAEPSESHDPLRKP